MNSEKKKALVAVIVGVFVLFAFLAFGPSSAMAADEIRIGFMAPMKGPLAKPGEDLLNGFKLFWKQNGLKAGGRPVKPASHPRREGEYDHWRLMRSRWAGNGPGQPGDGGAGARNARCR
ncbi:MAG: hypothetical protein JRJ51_05655 [Deltaproteobacteria bacterium]|nr:hypothetical protein [Deltaproteobacteria bacterium]